MRNGTKYFVTIITSQRKRKAYTANMTESAIVKPLSGEILEVVSVMGLFYSIPFFFINYNLN